MNFWKRILSKNLCNQIKQNFVNEQLMIFDKHWFLSSNQSRNLWTMFKNTTSRKLQRRNDLSFSLTSFINLLNKMNDFKRVLIVVMVKSLLMVIWELLEKQRKRKWRNLTSNMSRKLKSNRMFFETPSIKNSKIQTLTNDKQEKTPKF